MRKTITFYSATTLGLLLLLGAGSATTKPLTYLKPDSIDFVTLLPAPPAEGSPEEKAELDLIFQIQETRTDQDVARAQSEVKFSVFEFKSVLGEWFSEDKLPVTKAFFDKVAADSKAFSSAAKNHWTRKRPPYVDTRLHAAVLLEDEPSYPSGHATRGQLFAMILSTIEPEQEAALLSRGQLVGWDRVVGGVHYPSDVAAGRTLGQAQFHALMAISLFQSDLEQVKAEILKAHPLAAMSKN